MTSIQRSAETTVVSGIMLAMVFGVNAWSWSGWQPFNGSWFGNWHSPFSYQFRWFPPWHRPTPNPQPPVYCAQDVMRCADGTYVGRVPPACDFKACPAAPVTGTISGTVSIGPLCPVEPCPYPRPNPYAGRSVVLTPEAPNFAIIYVPLSASGAFSRAVPAGRYEVTLVPCVELGCRNALPKTAVVPANGTAQVTIDIDTGIR